jgi:hypothetical protein
LFSDISISTKVLHHSINEGQIMSTGSSRYQCWSNEAGIYCSARMRRQHLKTIRGSKMSKVNEKEEINDVKEL